MMSDGDDDVLVCSFRTAVFADELICYLCKFSQRINSYVDRFTLVHKTEVIKSTLNPTWRPFTVAVRTLCNGDLHRYLKIHVFEVS